MKHQDEMLMEWRRAGARAEIAWIALRVVLIPAALYLALLLSLMVGCRQADEAWKRKPTVTAPFAVTLTAPPGFAVGTITSIGLAPENEPTSSPSPSPTPTPNGWWQKAPGQDWVWHSSNGKPPNSSVRTP